MANDILNSELFQTQTTEKKTISTKPATETKKEGSSLFDSLLKDAKTKVDEGNSHQLNKDAAAKKIIDKTTTSPTISHQTTTKKESFDTVSSQVNRELIQKNDKGEVAKKSFPSQATQTNESVKNSVSIVTPTPTSSVTETMKTSGTKIVETTTQKPTEGKTDPKTLKKESPLTDKTTSNTVPNNISKKEEIKEEQKKPLSLLDKMMQDAKKDIQTEDKNLIKTVAPQKEDGILPQIVKENKVEKNLQVVEEKGKIAQTNLIPTKKEEVVKEVVKSNISSKIEEKKDLQLEKENHSSKLETVISKASKPASLLDKMVQEITDKDIKDIEEGEEKPEIQKTTPKTALKSDENVGKLFVELSEGIQLENTQKESNFEKKETKETKILSSLADSLSGKTKIQKKVDETTQLESLQDPKGQFGANIFLSNQKVQGELLSKQKLTEAKEVLKDGEKTTKTVKKSADILELKASSIEVVSEDETPTIVSKQTTAKSNDFGLHTQQTFLNRMFLNKESNEQILNSKVIEEKVAEIKTVTEDKKTNSDVTITVEKTLVETFTTKVIASKQAMGSFMSDVARNMYLNYKPPVTAFKINLDPLNLGSIAIVMRSNKGENSLSVSLNMSQNTTYETMNENKATLQNALGKVFNQNEGNISLDFGMQSDSSNQEFEQQKQNEHNKQTIQNRNSSETTIEKDEQTIDLDTTKSYM